MVAVTACTEVRHSLGVYVLGAIDAAERADVDSHLAGCAACRNELAALAGLPALLGRVSVEELESGLGEPETDSALLDGLLSRVTAERRRSRRLRLAAAAAAVLVVGGLGGGLGVALTEGTPAGEGTVAGERPASATFSGSDSDSGVSAKVTVRPKDWGGSLDITIEGVPPRTACHLVVVGETGRSDVAASWLATYQGDASMVGATGIAASEITRFKVVTATGRTLLTVPAAEDGGSPA